MPDASTPAKAAPAVESRPVFIPPKSDNADYEIVDSAQGKPWHEVTADLETYAKVKTGEIFPVTRKAFAARKSNP